MARGRGVPKSPEHRAKISAALKGRAVHGLHKTYNFGGHRCAPIRYMTDVERAYVGGLIDTDGCVYSKEDTYWVISFVNMELELISALLRLTGRGHVRLLPKRCGGKVHYIWEWTVWCQREVRQVAQQCAPYSLKLQKVGGDVKDGW